MTLPLLHDRLQIVRQTWRVITEVVEVVGDEDRFAPQISWGVLGLVNALP
jgi:hypothetical protein